jgi:DNA repair protein RecN (Recombination protein N)
VPDPRNVNENAMTKFLLPNANTLAKVRRKNFAMLTVLRIKNLALVDDLTLELQPGYNVISGETGAGKSIIIGALNLVLGERADRTLIRSGADACSVEACFDVSNVERSIAPLLEENGLDPCEENQLVLKRTFSSTGANRQFINGSPTTLQVLSVLGQGLVDIHGPHDHQSLLYPARQLSILDAFGNLQSHREEFSKLLQQRAVLEAEKAALIVDEKTYAQQLDLLRFQSNEIKTARLHPDEESQVEQEYRRSSNAARLLEASQAGLGILGGEEQSILTQAGALGRLLQELQRLDPGSRALLGLHEEVVQLLHDLQNDLSKYADSVEVDPQRISEFEYRLNLIHSLKRKYGSTLQEVIAFGEEANQKLRSLEQRDAELTRLQRELDENRTSLFRAGEALSAKRRKLIPKLCKAVTQQLNDLGFGQSHFDVDISTVSENESATFSPAGLDKIEFQFSPNPGEPLHLLRAIASSGELARVMLALKTVLADEDQVPVLVFDEVDANVGGETAHVVGEKMEQIARQRQVICITHLAPVAACAKTHFVVTKEVKGGRTISAIHQITEQKRIAELTRMLGGQSEAARKHAEALLAGQQGG